MGRRRRIYLETGARLRFSDPPKHRRKTPFLLAALASTALVLGFASRFEPTETSPVPVTVSPTDHNRMLEPRRQVATGAAAAELGSLSRESPTQTAFAAALTRSEGTRPRHSPARPGQGSQTDSGSPPPAHDTDGLVWVEHLVGRGDTLSGIFSRLGVHSQLHDVLATGDAEARELRRLFPNERLLAGLVDGRLHTLIYHGRNDHFLEFTVASPDGSFVAQRHEHALHAEPHTVVAQIEQSLSLDGSRAGLSAATLMQIAEIFGWDIDFAWDIRPGDRLIVIYERILRDGEYLRDGPVLAAEFQNRGRVLRALRHELPDGSADYFTPEGRSLRQAFIRTPVDVGRISSHFGPRRHPVLGYTRQHQGVDYAAPTGTPIRAAGNGRIVHRGDHGGYGKTVIIDHGNERRTLYAHMSRYQSDQSVGSRVSQGEVIGYVGSTGLATGPHLHYEFHIDGKPVNPVTLDLPRAEPLPANQMAAFRRATADLLAQIDALVETQIAEAGLEGKGPERMSR